MSTSDRKGRDRVIIANCSGFFGDRLSAAREMVRVYQEVIDAYR